MEYPFGINQDGDSNTYGRAYQVFITERLANIIRRATMMRPLMISVWSGTIDGSK